MKATPPQAWWSALARLNEGCIELSATTSSALQKKVDYFRVARDPA
jgi:hypothetical protein